MAIPFLRRRPAEEPKPTSKDEPRPPHSATKPTCPSSSSSIATMLLLLLLAAWCTTLLFSGAVFHLCISSRKLNVYCISANFAADVDAMRSLQLPDTLPSHNLTSSSSKKVVVKPTPTSEDLDERAIAIKEVQSQMRTLRSLAGSTNASNPGCHGRGVYVYDVPLKFNWDILGYCHEMIPWQDMCVYFTNDAMGEPLSSIGKQWYHTHQYALEPLFHQRALRHPCRVANPDDAKLFYVPFYGGLDVLRRNFRNSSNDAKDALGRELVQWLKTQRPWQRNGGKDHVFVLGKIAWDFRRGADKEWGNAFLSLDEMAAPFKLMIERQPWEHRDVGIPHPTYFHPHSDEDIAEWQTRAMSSARKHLVSFAGAARPQARENIREVLIEQCTAASGRCRFMDCRKGGCDRADAVMELFMESEFCLQPAGDSPTRKSVFDSLVAGCIPVFFNPFTAYYQYPWHLPEDSRRYSVMMEEEELRSRRVDVVERLAAIGATEREEMRSFIVHEIMPGLVYGDATSEFHRFTDAFGIAMQSVMNALTTSERSDTKLQMGSS